MSTQDSAQVVDALILAGFVLVGILLIGMVWGWMCERVDRRAEAEQQRAAEARAKRFKDLS